MTCTICNHPQVNEINNELLCRKWGAEGYSLEEIAHRYGVKVRDLQIHALMHVPVEQCSADAQSIAQKINMSEADILRQTSNNYYITLCTIGDKINQMLRTDESLRGITKPLVDLYLGAGAEIRNATECLVKMNQAINGENNSGLTALASLVNTIRGSESNKSEDES